MNSAHPTHAELREWQHTGFITAVKTRLPATIGEVRLYLSFNGSLAFSYKNARGLVFPDNGYLGPRPDGRDYYPLLRLSPGYSDDLRFGGTCQPTLEAVAAAVKESWRKFTT